MENIVTSEKTTSLISDKFAIAKANLFFERIDPIMNSLDQICKETLSQDANEVLGFTWDKAKKRYNLFIDYEALLRALK